MKKMVKFKFVTLLLMLMMVGSVSAQKADSVLVHETYTFHPHSFIRYEIDSSKWYISSNSEYNDEKLLSDVPTLNMYLTRNEKMIVDSVNVFVKLYYYRFVEIIPTIYIDKKYQLLDTRYEDKLLTFNYLDLVTDSLYINFIGNYFTVYYIIKNVTVKYHYYKKTTSIDEIINTNDISFSNGKFLTTQHIENIKLFDISGKLIQEGDLNTNYQTEQNKLYFVLFDNKYTKKIYITR